jgi:signal transduction histidine kinase
MKKRIHYIMKKKLQLRMTFRFIMPTIIFSIFIAFELYITAWPVFKSFISENEMDLVGSQVLFRLLCFSPPIIFVLGAFILIFSNRIAGPLYRFEKTLDKFLQGEDVDVIRLRENDELKELASKINDVILYVKELKGQKDL